MRNPPNPRICLCCGLPLPEGCSQSRKYCAECWKKKNHELSIKRINAAKAYHEKCKAEDQQQKDKEFCSKCFYRGWGAYFENLCDYLILTGTPRGCKAGDGCNKRMIPDDLKPKKVGA